VNDRFKFRAWDHAVCRMLNHDEEWVRKLVFDDVAPLLRSRFVLMQCTGLRAIDGTLIFEGDVCSLEASPFERDTHIGVAEFDDGMFFFGDEHVSNFGHITILGNIHANPELMEGE